MYLYLGFEGWWAHLSGLRVKILYVGCSLDCVRKGELMSAKLGQAVY